jgi:hypothetical protein
VAQVESLDEWSVVARLYLADAASLKPKQKAESGNLQDDNHGSTRMGKTVEAMKG